MGAPYREEDPFSYANRQHLNEQAAYWQQRRAMDVRNWDMPKDGAIDAEYRVIEDDEDER